MALDGSGLSTPRPAALPPGKTRYPLYRRPGGPQSRAGRVRKISPPPGFDPRTVQPVASRYNCALPAHEFTRKRPQMLTYTRQIQSTSLHPTSLSSILILFSNYRMSPKFSLTFRCPTLNVIISEQF